MYDCISTCFGLHLVFFSGMWVKAGHRQRGLAANYLLAIPSHWLHHLAIFTNHFLLHGHIYCRVSQFSPPIPHAHLPNRSESRHSTIQLLTHSDQIP